MAKKNNKKEAAPVSSVELMKLNLHDSWVDGRKSDVFMQCSAPLGSGPGWQLSAIISFEDDSVPGDADINATIIYDGVLLVELTTDDYCQASFAKSLTFNEAVNVLTNDAKQILTAYSNDILALHGQLTSWTKSSIKTGEEEKNDTGSRT